MDVRKVAAGAVAAYGAFKLADSKMNIMEDINMFKTLGPIAQQTQKWAETQGFTVADVWYLTLKGREGKTCIIDADSDRSFTFGQVEKSSNQVANWAVKHFEAGGVCALDMENRAEYFYVWLGLAKAGVAAALINNNIKGKALAHSIKAASATGLIFGNEVAPNVEDVVEALRGQGVAMLASFHSGGTGQPGLPPFADQSLDEVLAAYPDAPVPASRRAGLCISSPFGYIYTSGTTGLPKACKVSHLKLLGYSMVMCMYRCTPDDVIYGSGLPLYHTSGHLGLMHMVRNGATIVIRRKFSARTHWVDCKKYNATVMQYIGELCRYLLNTPQNAQEKQHSIRVAAGNGLRPEIWDQFQRRFNIPEIGEFYGATEGNGGLFNHCTQYRGQGAVGRAGWLLRKARPVPIVKFDVENEIPIRNGEGFCVDCDNNETGELLLQIKKVKTAQGEMDDFEGYTDKKASDSKILKNVFKKGDSYFRTGDLLRRDGQYFYFVDRIGDTFRWKGENVSTMEVSEVVSAYPGVAEANVFGVQVPGKDGRACAVALTLAEGASFDKAEFGKYVAKQLPSYAVPLILRFVPASEITGTFKHKKGDYRKEGCDPSTISDKLWWFSPATKTYEDFAAPQYQSIVSGKAKL